MTYEVHCVDCRQVGTTAVYHGESSRTLADRSLEHEASLRRQEEGSPLFKHWQTDHPEMKTPPEYEFKLRGRHFSPTERQLKEALQIQFSEADRVLNSKTEFGRNWVIFQAAEARPE